MNDLIDPEALGKIAGLVITTLLTGLGVNSLWRRRNSKDKLVMASDEGHVNIIELLQTERNEILARLDIVTKERDAAIREHSNAMMEIGGLRNEVHHLTNRITQQSKDILQQSTKIEQLERQTNALRSHIDSLMGLRDAGIPVAPPKGD